MTSIKALFDTNLIDPFYYINYKEEAIIYNSKLDAEGEDEEE